MLCWRLSITVRSLGGCVLCITLERHTQQCASRLHVRHRQRHCCPNTYARTSYTAVCKGSNVSRNHVRSVGLSETLVSFKVIRGDRSLMRNLQRNKGVGDENTCISVAAVLYNVECFPSHSNQMNVCNGCYWRGSSISCAHCLTNTGMRSIGHLMLRSFPPSYISSSPHCFHFAPAGRYTVISRRSAANTGETRYL